MRVFIIDKGQFKLVDGPAMAHGRLKRLLMTPISSMYGFINKGSRVLNYFHKKVTQETVLAMMSEIKILIKVYEKNISLHKLGVRIFTPENYASEALEIELEYNVSGKTQETVIRTGN